MTSDDLQPIVGDAETTKSGNENAEPDVEISDNPGTQIPDGMSAQRVFKKVSPNQKLTLYLSSRDLIVSPEGIDRIQGVLLVDPEFVEERKVYGQVTLTFRYGREDEEVMGLKFCNEAIMCLVQLYPPNPSMSESITPLQEALIKRLGSNAYPFNLEITPLAPPSVQLVPAKEYHGAPIGTSYDIRAYVDRVDEKLHRRSTIRMGIRVVQRAYPPPSPHMYVPGGGGRTCKERARQHRRALLFSYKNTWLDTTTCAKSEKDSQNLHILGNFENQENGSRLDNLTRNDTYKEKVTLSRSNNMDVDKHRDVRQGKEEESAKIVGKKEDDKAEDLEIEERKLSEVFYNYCGGKRPSLAAYLASIPPPKACVEKIYLLSEGKICLTATLDKAVYSHGEYVKVTIHINNNSNKSVKRLKIFIVQHVDVCMFSNGKFKNVVASLNSKEDCPIHHGNTFEKTFSLVPVKSTTKNWIALEESYNKCGTSLASTVTSTNNPDDRNVFAIYVSYYVKVKLLVNRMGGDLSLKLPFTLMHTCCDIDQNQTETLLGVRPEIPTDLSRPDEQTNKSQEIRDEAGVSTSMTCCQDDVKQEKDGT
ncbi:arrestin homolog isoform X1 [Diorhabda carinulata]|uniref:arrestin homolog isoform X1 n=1 Tax=Diorhabda carinulata TaxID=1163345 RepID=UPI0025A2F96C|nr:arrestin homolog isoform X1 [Diorhabda carinulata]